jgi:cytochrome c peroxidase
VPFSLSVVLALIAAAPSAFASEPGEFSAVEIARIASLGPWPPLPRHDPSNRASGHPDAIELGRRLFFDSRLSPVGYIACVTCHQPDRGWTDHKPRAHGLGDLDRNTQPLNNVGLQRWLGWGGASDSVWMASLRPIVDPREMDSNPAHVRHVYVRMPEYACLYRLAYGIDPVTGGETDEAVLVRSAKALAAFTETLFTGRTPFDVARDALARRGAIAGTGYPAAARRGLRFFVGKGGCISCHSGPNFSDGMFHDAGVSPFPGQGAPDLGRQDGMGDLRSSRYTLRGRYNDDPSGRDAAAAREIGPDDVAAPGRFRTPSLRNVAVTGPYMHNGSVELLRDAARHRARSDGATPNGATTLPANAFGARGADLDDVVAFLETLTDVRGEDRGLPAPRLTRCDGGGAPVR